jgi:NADH-quinone oxidoreductase subunit L
MNGLDWDERFTASLIRWIALLPLLASLAHAAMIGLLRVQIAPRTVWLLSTSALVVSFLLSATSIFDLVGGEQLGPIVDRVGPWLGGGVGTRNFSADLSLHLDPLSSVFCVVVTSIALAIYVYALGRMQSGALPGDQVHRLFAFLDLLVGSTLVLLLADNLILFFFGWTGIGVASQLLSTFDYESERASRSSATTFVIGRVGDLALLASILLLFDGLARSGAPALTFEGVEAAYRLLEGSQVELPTWLGGGGFPLLELVGAGLALAAMTKCAQVPLHFWMAGASQGPTTATALIHSATTVVAGSYVLLRCSFLLDQAPPAMNALVGFGSATVLVAGLAAATQLDLLRIVAYSTSAALGFVLIGIGLGAYSTATFLLLSHAYAKAHLILAFGIVQASQKGETDLRRLGGLARSMRWTHSMAAVAGLAVIGVPPIGNFFALEELLAWVASVGHPAVLAACLSSVVLMAFALTRAHLLIFWGGRPNGSPNGESIEVRTGQDPTGMIRYGLTLLAIMTISVGILSPSQFWGGLFGVAHMDTIGGFLSQTLAGAADPGLEGALRWQSIGAFVVCMFAGAGWAAYRHARHGHRGAFQRPALETATEALREAFFVEQAFSRLVVRPLRAFSRLLLAGAVEARLLDRVVVTGGAGLARRLVWTGLRRLQNGRVQSYAMLSVIALLLSLAWLTD